VKLLKPMPFFTIHSSNISYTQYLYVIRCLSLCAVFVCILIANWTRLIMLKVVRLTSCMYFVNVYINRRLDAANMTQQLFICRKGELSKWRTRNITQAQWGIYTMGNLFVVFEK
jgi:hypothetical protein